METVRGKKIKIKILYSSISRIYFFQHIFGAEKIGLYSSIYGTLQGCCEDDTGKRELRMSLEEEKDKNA